MEALKVMFNNLYHEWVYNYWRPMSKRISMIWQTLGQEEESENDIEMDAYDIKEEFDRSCEGNIEPDLCTEGDDDGVDSDSPIESPRTRRRALDENDLVGYYD